MIFTKNRLQADIRSADQAVTTLDALESYTKLIIELARLTTSLPVTQLT